MTELRKKYVLDSDGTTIDPATKDKQQEARDTQEEQKTLQKQIIINQQIIISHLEILSNTIINEEDLSCR